MFISRLGLCAGWVKASVLSSPNEVVIGLRRCRHVAAEYELGHERDFWDDVAGG